MKLFHMKEMTGIVRHSLVKITKLVKSIESFILFFSNKEDKIKRSNTVYFISVVMSLKFKGTNWYHSLACGDKLKFDYF